MAPTAHRFGRCWRSPHGSSCHAALRYQAGTAGPALTKTSERLFAGISTSSSSSSPWGAAGIAVLVVDDEPFVRMDLAETLRRAGFNVEEASNSDEALRKLNGAGYPLRALVTDVQMLGP
jgi:PleD family two-component response regulator